MRRLAVVDIGAGGDPKRCDSDTGNQRHYHDLEVGRTICGMKGVVHLSPQALETPLRCLHPYARSVSGGFRGFRKMVSRSPKPPALWGGLRGGAAQWQVVPKRIGVRGEKQ